MSGEPDFPVRSAPPGGTSMAFSTTRAPDAPGSVTLDVPVTRAAVGMRRVSWVVVGGSVATLELALAVGAPAAVIESVLSVGQVLIFVALLARTVVAVVQTPRRWTRIGLLGLLGGLLTWMSASMVVSGADPQDAPGFPHPGEVLFLTSYLGFSGFLVLGGHRWSAERSGRLSSAVVDALIVCGGTASTALLLMVTPVARPTDGSELPQLVALLYPLLDLALLVLLVAQLTLRTRSLDRRALTLVAALIALMAADLSLVLTLGQAARLDAAGLLPDQLWVIGFLLLVDGATSPSVPDDTGGSRAGRGGGGTVVLVAGLAAVAALTVDVPGTPQLLTHAVGVATLAAAGLRMAVAVRQAHRLNDELRRSRIDDLTGLLNRRGAEERLGRLLEGPGPVGLVMLDLDGFREVNDGLGHEAGDAVLRVVADRIGDDPLAEISAARLGGDEYAVLARSDDEQWLLEQAQRLIQVVRRPVRADGMEVTLDASAGVAVSAPGLTPRDLLRRAEVAMYAAKEGHRGAQLYDPGCDGFSRERLQEGGDLSHALATGQIVAFYQPQLHADTERPCGLEALVRWVHPEHGVVPPLNFLPAARRTGRMPALTKAVMECAIRDTAAWWRSGIRTRVAVNMAPAELLAPGMLDTFFSLAAASGLPPGALVLEVTEESFAHGERTREAIEAIRAAGHEVSIDDYGTGFSSLSYLRDLPVQELKIDRSFVMHVAQERTGMIVKATIELAHALGMRVVAEGVSDPDIAVRLRDLGADELQGFLYGRPMPAADIADWWRAQEARAATSAVAGTSPGVSAGVPAPRGRAAAPTPRG
ncbi:MAG: bifunctional diguanylate cyclase/phosphodiesterase [Kineosporiaceae bacterium]